MSLCCTLDKNKKEHSTFLKSHGWLASNDKGRVCKDSIDCYESEVSSSPPFHTSTYRICAENPLFMTMDCPQCHSRLPSYCNTYAPDLITDEENYGRGTSFPEISMSSALSQLEVMAPLFVKLNSLSIIAASRDIQCKSMGFSIIRHNATGLRLFLQWDSNGRGALMMRLAPTLNYSQAGLLGFFVWFSKTIGSARDPICEFYGETGEAIICAIHTCLGLSKMPQVLVLLIALYSITSSAERIRWLSLFWSHRHSEGKPMVSFSFSMFRTNFILSGLFWFFLGPK